MIVGDRPDDMEAALEFMAGQGLDVILTSGGLGPTADDLTAEVVGRFQDREMTLDEALEERSPRSCARFQSATRTSTAKRSRWARASRPPYRAGRPCSTRSAPLQGSWSHRAAARAAQRSSCCRVLRASCNRCGSRRRQRSRSLGDRGNARHTASGCCACSGSPSRRSPRLCAQAEREGLDLNPLEITTCLRGGEIEVVTRFEADAQDAYDAFVRVVEKRHADTLYSVDGTTVDDQVAALLRGDVGGETAHAHRSPSPSHARAACCWRA